MTNNDTLQPWIKAFSSLSINFSAAWFGLAFITPNFTDVTNTDGALLLTKDIGAGIVFLLTCVYLEKILSEKF